MKYKLLELLLQLIFKHGALMLQHVELLQTVISSAAELPTTCMQGACNGGALLLQLLLQGQPLLMHTPSLGILLMHALPLRLLLLLLSLMLKEFVSSPRNSVVVEPPCIHCSLFCPSRLHLLGPSACPSCLFSVSSPHGCACMGSCDCVSSWGCFC